MYSNIKISKIIKAVSLMCALFTVLFSVSCGDVENENTHLSDGRDKIKAFLRVLKSEE